MRAGPTTAGVMSGGAERAGTVARASRMLFRTLRVRANEVRGQQQQAVAWLAPATCKPHNSLYPGGQSGRRRSSDIESCASTLRVFRRRIHTTTTPRSATAAAACASALLPLERADLRQVHHALRVTPLCERRGRRRARASEGAATTNLLLPVPVLCRQKGGRLRRRDNSPLSYHATTLTMSSPIT